MKRFADKAVAEVFEDYPADLRRASRPQEESQAFGQLSAKAKVRLMPRTMARSR
jgi:hypothetical protein